MIWTEQVTVKLRNKVSGKVSSSKTLSYTVCNTTVGWSVGGGTVTGLQNQIAEYGDPAACRIFSPPGSGLKPWTSGILAALPKDSVLVYSIKDWPVDVYGWMSSRPSTLTTPYYFCLDHEPEQGTTAGDPSPATYQQEWRELIAQVANHPRRKEMRLLPIFTEYYAKRNASWLADFGQVAGWAGVDAIGFDVYDLAYSSYRTVTDRFALPLAEARRVRKPLVLAEWGIDRKTAIDPDGSVAAKNMRDSVTYLRKQPDVPYVTWWHDSNNALWDRPAEKQALKDLIATNP